MSKPRFALPKLVAASVRRDYRNGQSDSQGGLFTVDFAKQDVRQLVDWSSPEVDFRGRGIVFHGDEVYVASYDELFVYGRDFRIRRSYKSAYLSDCQAAFRADNTLYLVSGANDCLLAFDFAQQSFFWAMHLAIGDGAAEVRAFDPLGISGPGGASGPPAENLLDLNSIWVDKRGLFLSGARTCGLWYIGAEHRPRKAVDLPPGTHDARPYRDGVLFNDSAAGAVRYAGRDGSEQAFAIPVPGSSDPAAVDSPGAAAGGNALARGLCAVDEHRFVAGSSPSTVSLYDLESGSRVASVNFSGDVRYAIHALEVWR